MVQEWGGGATQQEDHHLPCGQVRHRAMVWELAETSGLTAQAWCGEGSARTVFETYREASG